MKKTIAILMCCLMLLALVAGCGADKATAEKPEDRVLQMRTVAALVSTDWANSTLTYDMQVLWVHVFESLYGMDEAHGGYYNQLAKDIQVSDDGLTYTVSLVDATFQNGDPLTAEDVVYSYEVAKQNSRFNYVTSFINKIEAKDEKTVLFHLDYPYSAISHTFWTIKIMSKREHQEILASGKQFGTEPHTCGTGPYILKSFDNNGTILEAYENYWGGAPEIKHVKYQVISDDAAAVIAYENGELDYFDNLPTSDWENVKKVAGENCAMVKGNDIAALFINWMSPTNNNILGNEKVREAIFYCINKQDCVQAATGGYGTPAYEYMPSEYVATSPNYRDGSFTTYDYDLEKAKQCMLDAGFTQAEMDAGIDIGTIMTYGDPNAHKGKEAVVIQANLAAIGLKAEIEIGDYSMIWPYMSTQDYDIAIFGDNGNYDYNNIRQQVHSESTGMYIVLYKADNSPFDWQKMESLVDAGVATADVAERYEIYTELWSMVMDTKTIYPILHQATAIAWSDRIELGGICPLYYHIDQMSWADVE